MGAEREVGLVLEMVEDLEVVQEVGADSVRAVDIAGTILSLVTVLQNVFPLVVFQPLKQVRIRVQQTCKSDG